MPKRGWQQKRMKREEIEGRVARGGNMIEEPKKEISRVKGSCRVERMNRSSRYLKKRRRARPVRWGMKLNISRCLFLLLIDELHS